MKLIQKMKGGLAASVAFATAMVMSANAAAADWSTVTAGVDFSGEITAVQAIIGIIATVIVVMTGGKFLLSALKRG